MMNILELILDHCLEEQFDVMPELMLWYSFLLSSLKQEHNLIQFIDYIVRWDLAQETKYPYLVSELMNTKEDLVPIMAYPKHFQYLLTFLDYPQNETSCGYFEKALRPLIVLHECSAAIDLRKLVNLCEFESISNILIGIVLNTNFTEEFRLTVMHAAFTVPRVLNCDSHMLSLWAQQYSQDVADIYNHQSMDNLRTIELLIDLNIINVQWLVVQLESLQEQQMSENFNGNNFLASVPKLGEYKLKLVQILAKTIHVEQTKLFQGILLKLLVHHEWNNQLQNIAVRMYQQLIPAESPHTSFFMAIFKPFFMGLNFNKQDLKMKKKVTRGFQWVFTEIIKLLRECEAIDPEMDQFIVDQQLAERMDTEGRYLLNRHPMEPGEKRSINIMEMLNERLQNRQRIKQQQQQLESENGDVPDSGRQSFGEQNYRMEIEEGDDTPPILKVSSD